MTDGSIRAEAPARHVGVLAPLKALTSGREIIQNLTLREIRSQYKRTMLGRLWSFVNPLAQLVIFSIVFGLVFRMQIPPGENSGLHTFALWLAAALIPWGFISSTTTAGMNSLVGNGGLLTKVSFPRHALPISVVLSSVVTFLTELSVITLVMAIFGGPRVLLLIPLVLLAVALTTVFVAGIALALSVALVYFRDMQHIMSIFIQVWFYATPIIYPVTLIHDLQQRLNERGIPVLGSGTRLVDLYELNPAYRFVELFRDLLYHFTVPSLSTWLWCLGWALVSYVVGAMIFSRYQARVVEEL